MVDKPKGGRGKKAPYDTKLMRVPEPIAPQVDALGLQYQEFIAAGGDPANPPFFRLEITQKQPDAVEQKHAETAGDRFEKTSSEFVEAQILSKQELLWNQLNRRQQIYLRLIFEIDQHREAKERGQDWRRSSNTPASQWRWIEYAEIFGKSTTLRARIKEAGEVDPGTGSTFKALSARKLIEIRYPYGSDVPWLDCKLTRQGRAVVRAGLRLQAPKKPPKGQLRERQWAALVAAYIAGDRGVKKDVNLNYGGFSWEWTWLRLRDYSEGSLIQERALFKAGRYEHDLIISQFGRYFYRSNWKKYRELYPNINAPEPT